MARRRLRLKKKVKRFLYKFVLTIIVIIVVFSWLKSPKEETKSIPEQKEVVKITVNPKDIYLIKGESYTIDYNEKLKYTIDNTDIISFDKGVISSNNAGNSKLLITNDEEVITLNITVTDLLEKANINNNKSYLQCHSYSDEEAALLDKYLEYRINEKGYLTRAGAVEAVRFLTLNFPFRLKYFYENGRLDRSNSFFDYVDGEGRYYHKGLYLTDNKFNDLKATLRGPQPWGCPIYNDTTKTNNPNGLDCSGFMTWALVNAGYDPGDVGAGRNNYNDITDIGDLVEFTQEDAFDNVKVGDLVGRKGHIAMIIGMYGDKYYIGEALDSGQYDMHVYSYTKEELINSHFTYFVYLDKFYKKDGNITNMWS